MFLSFYEGINFDFFYFSAFSACSAVKVLGPGPSRTLRACGKGDVTVSQMGFEMLLNFVRGHA